MSTKYHSVTMTRSPVLDGLQLSDEVAAFKEAPNRDEQWPIARTTTRLVFII